MKLHLFQTSLGNPYLQRHLLAIQPRNLEDAIRAGNGFLQIRTFHSNSSIRQVEEGEAEDHRTSKVEDPMSTLLKAVAKLTEEVNALKVAPRSHVQQTPSHQNSGFRCFGCHRDGHVRRNCPTKPWPKGQEGNETGSQ